MDWSTIFFLIFWGSCGSLVSSVVYLIFGPDPLRAAKWLAPIGLSAVLALAWVDSGPVTSAAPVAASLTCRDNYTVCASQDQLVENYKRMNEARSDCRREAQKLARYGDAQLPSLPFLSYLTTESSIDTGKISLVENEARYQNGFGAMQHTIVTCIYDLDAREIVEVSAVAK